jgi:hypothetical protein
VKKVIELLEEARRDLIKYSRDTDYENLPMFALSNVEKALDELDMFSPEPAEKGYWWCPNCKKEISGATVTYQELHDTCGHPVEWIEPAPRYKSKPRWYTPERWEAETGEAYPPSWPVWFRYRYQSTWSLWMTLSLAAVRNDQTKLSLNKKKTEYQIVCNYMVPGPPPIDWEPEDVEK